MNDVSVEITAILGYCLECKLPTIIVNGKLEAPTKNPNDVVLIGDQDDHRRARLTWHHKTCEKVCTSWEDCDTI